MKKKAAAILKGVGIFADAHKGQHWRGFALHNLHLLVKPQHLRPELSLGNTETHPIRTMMLC